MVWRAATALSLEQQTELVRSLIDAEWMGDRAATYDASTTAGGKVRVRGETSCPHRWLLIERGARPVREHAHEGAPGLLLADRHRSAHWWISAAEWARVMALYPAEVERAHPRQRADGGANVRPTP